MISNNEIRIRLRGRLDKSNHEFYVGVVNLPASMDLSDTVFLFFPDEEGEDFGGDLVIKKHEPKPKRDLGSDPQGSP